MTAQLQACCVALLILLATCHAFAPPMTKISSRSALRMASYVPDGVSPEAWEAMRQQKSDAAAKKNLGTVGTTKFRSRSFQAFHQSLESGRGGHLFPVDLRKVKAGEIKPSQVPYMMRNKGAWDDSDVVDKEPGVVKKQWLPADKAYANGGERAAQSINLFGTSINMPWKGRAAYEPTVAEIEAAEKQQRSARAQAVPKASRPVVGKSAAAASASIPELSANKRFFFF